MIFKFIDIAHMMAHATILVEADGALPSHQSSVFYLRHIQMGLVKLAALETIVSQVLVLSVNISTLEEE